MTQDPFAQFKAVQREGWALFAPLEALTTPPAAQLVEFAKIPPAESAQPPVTVLDVACGTGVVAVTAARRGAQVKGLDLSPVLLERANLNAKTAGVEIDFTEGDAESLPYPDKSFDFVLSQFGHMFAPRPEVVVAEMLRVLKPGGTLAFSTWPPELFTGQMFALVSRYLPPPEGLAPPPLWGDPNVIRTRLGEKVENIFFDRQEVRTPTLSPQHTRQLLESTAGPLTKLSQVLAKENPAKLEQFRRELEKLIANFSRQNIVWQSFLMTRSTKSV